MEGKRYNEGKTRHDLVPAFAQEQYARVLTVGANKYEERNWERGMLWTTVMASMKRHQIAWERGEDIDPETGLLHTAHMQANAAFLTQYYKIFPQGDDRPHSYLSPFKIGLDVDEVIAGFVEAYTAKYGLVTPEFWNFDPHIKERLSSLDKDFWLNLPPKFDPKELRFEPHCYITSRGIPNEWTEQWIINNGFPIAPVHTVGVDQSKVEVAKEAGVDIFVDDRYENFLDLNRSGICCFLLDAAHNKRYNVGHKRIFNLNDLI